MQTEHPATYRDKLGVESTLIHNDGQRLSMVVRNVAFEGEDFDMLEPVGGTDLAMRQGFTLNDNCICSCLINAKIPIRVVTPDACSEATLSMKLELGEPATNGGIDKEVLTLALHLGPATFRSNGKSGWFENELLDIQQQLLAGTYMKACINCAFSDYSPYGHGLFGCMACFRDNKQAYLSVKSKSELFAIWDSMTEFVQETYVCPEFQRRRKGTGYRG